MHIVPLTPQSGRSLIQTCNLSMRVQMTTFNSHFLPKKNEKIDREGLQMLKRGIP